MVGHFFFYLKTLEQEDVATIQVESQRVRKPGAGESTEVTYVLRGPGESDKGYGIATGCGSSLRVGFSKGIYRGWRGVSLGGWHR